MTRIEERRIKWLESVLDSAYRELDRFLISLSVSAIALSATFVSNLSNVKWAWIATTSWTFFSVSILLVLTTLLLEQWDKRHRLKELYSHATENDTFANKAIVPMNIANVFSFFIGLALLVIFLSINPS